MACGVHVHLFWTVFGFLRRQVKDRWSGRREEEEGVLKSPSSAARVLHTPPLQGGPDGYGSNSVSNLSTPSFFFILKFGRGCGRDRRRSHKGSVSPSGSRRPAAGWGPRVESG